MISRLSVGAMALCLVLYIILVGQRVVALLWTGEPIAITMAIALIILPLIAAWALVRELQFGFAADRLGKQLNSEGTMPTSDAERTPSGRLVAGAAEPLIQEYRDLAAASPEDWRAQFRLGVVQDAAGKRKDARASIRSAITLEKAAPSQR